MHDIQHSKPPSLGYYKVQLRPGSPLYKLYGMDVITARYIERDANNGTHRFFDLPRPNEGVDGWELVAAN